MSRKKQNRDDFKREDVLQAVVICDSFDTKFAPLSENRPKALFPLGNKPLLQYTLDLLSEVPIQEVILFCTSHTAEIEEFINQGEGQLKEDCAQYKYMDINIIVSETCASVGDVLRDLDSRQIIHNDFVLLHADVIGSVDLAPIIEEHKQRRLAEKTPVMTLIMKPAMPNNPIRSSRDDECIVAAKEDHVYMFKKTKDMSKFNVPLSMLLKVKELRVRQDLLDCQVSICSPIVPTLFTDNFDYQTREEFVRGILENEEVMGNTIHMHVTEQHAARVTTPRRYDVVSMNLLERWCGRVASQDDNYTYHLPGHIYLHKANKLRRGNMKARVMVGKDTTIGVGATISNSIIGKNCKIGNNVTLKGAYLWDNVVVEDNCSVTSAILGYNVHLKTGVKVNLGCLLADNVVVGPNKTLEKGTSLTTVSVNDGFDDDEEDDKVTDDPSVVGKEGRGHVYRPAEDSDDSDSEDGVDLAAELMGEWSEREDKEDEESSDDSDDEMMEAMEPPPDDYKLFSDEVIGTLVRAVEDNIGLENMVLEINSLKHGFGLQIKEVNNLVTKAIFELPFQINKSITKDPEYLAGLNTVLKKMMPVLSNYIRSEESMMDCLAAIESLCATNEVVAAVFVKFLHALYTADLLSEEAIIRWHRQAPLDEHEVEGAELRKKVDVFIEWLEEADEESSDDEEESD